MNIKFTKMHGLGNDFIVIDAINQNIKLGSDQVRYLCDRHFGIGCDQLLLVESATASNADFRYRIFNADGGEVAQCGNGARCFALFVQEKKLSLKKDILVDTDSGQLLLHLNADNQVTVNMGSPKFSPQEIPLTIEQQAAVYSLSSNQQDYQFSAVSMGNPHAVLLVDDTETAPVEDLGMALESHPVFPQRANIGFMQIINRQHVKLRVFERGVGETLACGSGACAAAVIGIARNLLDQQVNVDLPGGRLAITWPGELQPVLMTGPATIVFEGYIDL